MNKVCVGIDYSPFWIGPLTFIYFFFCGSRHSGNDIGLLRTVVHDALSLFFIAIRNCCPRQCVGGSVLFLYFNGLHYLLFLMVRFCECETQQYFSFVWCIKFGGFFFFGHPFPLCILVQSFIVNQMQFQLLTLQTKWVLCLKIIAIELRDSFHILSSSFCARCFFKAFIFSNCSNCSVRIHRNLRTCMDRESEDQQPAHYQGIIVQPIYTCSLQGQFSRTHTRTHTVFTQQFQRCFWISSRPHMQNQWLKHEQSLLPDC